MPYPLPLLVRSLGWGGPGEPEREVGRSFDCGVKAAAGLGRWGGRELVLGIIQFHGQPVPTGDAAGGLPVAGGAILNQVIEIVSLPPRGISKRIKAGALGRGLGAHHHRLGTLHLGEKQARCRDPPRAAVVAHPRATGMHLLPTSGDPHEHQSPLFLELIRPIEAPLVR